MTTVAGGVSGNVIALPLSGLGFDGAQPDDVTQAFSSNAVLTSVVGQITTNSSMSLIGTTITVTAQVYSAPPGLTPQPVPGSQCTAVPSFTGIIAIGTTATFNCSGLSIPILAGDVGYIQVSATAAGITLINSIPIHAAVSLGLAG